MANMVSGMLTRQKRVMNGHRDIKHIQWYVCAAYPKKNRDELSEEEWYGPRAIRVVGVARRANTD